MTFATGGPKSTEWGLHPFTNLISWVLTRYGEIIDEKWEWGRRVETDQSCLRG